MNKYYQLCSSCILDTSVPDIIFDNEGECNYCKIHRAMSSNYPQGEIGMTQWLQYVDKIRKVGKNKEFDCIIGVSGGTDSSYLLHLANEYKLRPLAVNFDNGWNSDIAVSNIKKVISKLNIPLYTYVVDYEEMKDLLLSFMKAGLPWIDAPTDFGINSSLYKVALKHNISYVLFGADFRSEGKQPIEWTYTDLKQIKYIIKNFGTKKNKSFPLYNLFNMTYNMLRRNYNIIFPFYYLEYNKQDAQTLIKQEYDWQYYGEHHHESLFTKFAIGYWLYNKFNIDKRKVTYSAQVREGKISRSDALDIVSKPPFKDNIMSDSEFNYLINKLEIEKSEFDIIWNKTNKTFRDYPNLNSLINKIQNRFPDFIELVIKRKPGNSFLNNEVKK